MLRFLSLATLTQAATIGSQLLLLPLQIHIWGHDAVALWLSTLALSAVLGFCDLGLRNAGFAALATNAPVARFDTLWTIMRGHMVLATLIVLGIVAVWLAPRAGGEGTLFLFVLAVAASIEVLIGLRVTFMEAKGLITPAEAVSFGMAAARLVIGVALLATLKASPLVLSFVWLGTALAALFAQTVFSVVNVSSPIFGRWSLGGWRDAYADALWSTATPLTQWAQIHMPVVALSAFAPPALVSSFVALRSIFGLMRSILQQLSRLASIRYGEWARAWGEARAQASLQLVAAVAGWISLGFGLALFAESFTFTGRLFDLPPDNGVRLMALGLAFSSILSVHQLFTLSLARFGRFALTGAANYAYVAGVAVACVVAASMKDVVVLVAGLVLCDAALLAVAALVLLRGSDDAFVRRSRLNFAATVLAGLAVSVLCWRVFMAPAVETRSLLAVIGSMAEAGVVWLIFGAVLWWRVGRDLREIFAPAEPVQAAPSTP